MTAEEVKDEAEDRAGQVLMRLHSEQNLLRGSIAALICGSLGFALAHAVFLTDVANRTTIATAFIGVLVAFGMRQWGRGVDRRFRVISFFVTLILMTSSVLLASCVARAARSRFTLDQMIGFLNPSFAWELIKESADASSIFLWSIGLAIAWSKSGRNPRSIDLSS